MLIKESVFIIILFSLFIIIYSQGEEWLNQLNDYLFENRKYAEKVLAEIPNNKVKVVKGRATYLLWVKVFQNGDVFAEELRRKTGLFINGGAEYGKSGESFVRINLACSRKTLEEAMARFKEMF